MWILVFTDSCFSSQLSLKVWETLHTNKSIRKTPKIGDRFLKEAEIISFHTEVQKPKARKSRKTDDVAAKARKSKKEEYLLTTFVQSVSLLGIAFHTSPYRTFNGQR